MNSKIIYHVSFPKLKIFLEISPIAVNFKNISIYWYGIIIATGFLLGYLYVNKRSNEFGSYKTEKKAKLPGLYVKLPKKGGKEEKRAFLLISIFDGIVPVYAYYEDSKKLIRNPEGLKVDVNDVLVRELKEKLGEKNVAVVL